MRTFSCYSFSMMKCVVLLIALLLSATALHTSPARAGGTAGRYGILLITEKGGCDRGFRYPVLITTAGAAGYQGDADIAFAGTVSSEGAMKFTAAKGTMSASGTGKIADGKGAGKWSGKNASGACSGRWEATRD
jgi:hypothetical protein